MLSLCEQEGAIKPEKRFYYLRPDVERDLGFLVSLRPMRRRPPAIASDEIFIVMIIFAAAAET